MSSESIASDRPAITPQVRRLLDFHRRPVGMMVWPIAIAFGLFLFGSTQVRIDEVAGATGEIIAVRRVQVIQAVDGGVIAELNVREGDRVAPGQVLARFDQGRLRAELGEVEARLSAMQIRAARLRAELLGSEELVIAQDLSARFPELVAVERALFEQRATSLRDELTTLETALDIAREEAELVEKLEATGDANASERLKVRRAVNDAEAAIINRRNEFAEQAQSDLSKVEDEIAQTSQVRARQLQELEASVFTALVPGIVKNIAVTTIGGVVRSGEEIMQIVPVDDDLVLETRITPADISRVRPGLPANIRLDPFDYTIFGALPGVVTYVSADTMKEETTRGEDIYYRVHVRPTSDTTGTGRHLEILPGMTAQVDIRAGDRSLFDYLMKPLRKVMTEALREK